MNARLRVKEILLSKMMQKWVLIAQHPQVYPHFPPARARKNYARLFDKYPELAEKIGLHEFSAF